MLAFIVFALFVAIAVVLVIWCLSPAYRKRIEEPKYRFQEKVDAYEKRTKPSDDQEKKA